MSGRKVSSRLFLVDPWILLLEVGDKVGCLSLLLFHHPDIVLEFGQFNVSICNQLLLPFNDTIQLLQLVIEAGKSCPFFLEPLRRFFVGGLSPQRYETLVR
jgi:hypothetical protein